MTRNWIIIAVILVLVLLGLGYTLTQRGNLSQTSLPTPPQAPAEVTIPEAIPPETSPTATVSATIVKITQSGFSPKTVTIKVGEAVTWMNDDSAVHTVNSAVHPTHQVYPPLNLGNIQAGGKLSLTFPEAGTYKYHDHLNPSLTGSVTVE